MAEKNKNNDDNKDKDINLSEEVELQWDAKNDVPMLYFKSSKLLEVWFTEESTQLKLSNNKLSTIQIYFLKHIFESIRKATYKQKKRIRLFSVSVRNQVYYVLDIKEEYFRFCLEEILRTATIFEEYELCSKIQKLITELDDVRDYLKTPKIKHKDFFEITF